MQDVLRRLERAFANYFARVEKRKTDKRIKLGYPRFKSASSYSSITYPQAGNGWKDLVNGHFWLSKLGEIRTFRHRSMRGTSKTLTVKRDRAGDWFVVIVCKIQGAVHSLHQSRKTVLGVDLGLKRLVATSSGEFVEAPKFYRRAERRLQTLQKALSRKQNWSSNHVSATLRLAKAHRKIERT